MPSTRPELDIVNDEPALDHALENTFPASDPPAATSFTPPAISAAANDEQVAVWLVVARDCAEKPVEQWRSCGQGRWVTPNVQALFASLSPATALLEALVNQDLAESTDPLMMVSLKLPASGLLRLDTPPENWRDRPYRAEVRRCGDRWALEHQSLALRVPSALCPAEHNVLINMLHPEFASLQRGEPEPMDIDPRLRRA